jgi:hypothetical protein
VNPKRYQNDVVSKLKNKDFIIFTEQGDTLSGQEGKKASINLTDGDDGEVDDLRVKVSITQRVINYFKYDSYDALAFRVQYFHSNKEEMIHLAYTYQVLKNAEASLLFNHEFIVPNVGLCEEYDPVTMSDSPDLYEAARWIIDYKNDIASVKKIMLNSYRSFDAVMSNATVRAFYTTCGDFSYHLMLRMIRLTHKYFINHVMGLNGHVLYTNIDDFKIDFASKDSYFVLN